MPRNLGSTPEDDSTEWFPRIRMNPEQKARYEEGYRMYVERHPGVPFASFVKTAMELLIRVEEEEANLAVARKLRKRK